MREFYHADCMEVMRRYPDKYFDLAIVDPPYGINIVRSGKIGKGGKHYGAKDWDRSIPDKTYFEELFRVSRHQIIWGGNYFIEHLRNARCVIVWDKVKSARSFADCEIAWTSFDSVARIFRFRWNGFLQGDMKNKEKRIHPTQKPVALYRWMVERFASPGARILDTHVGSASSLIAFESAGLDYVGCEMDADYFRAASERLDKFRKSGTTAA